MNICLLRQRQLIAWFLFTAYRSVAVHGETSWWLRNSQRTFVPVSTSEGVSVLSPAPSFAPRCQTSEPPHQRVGRTEIGRFRWAPSPHPVSVDNLPCYQLHISRLCRDHFTATHNSQPQRKRHMKTGKFLLIPVHQTAHKYYRDSKGLRRPAPISKLAWFSFSNINN